MMQGIAGLNHHLSAFSLIESRIGLHCMTIINNSYNTMINNSNNVQLVRFTIIGIYKKQMFDVFCAFSFI